MRVCRNNAILGPGNATSNSKQCNTSMDFILYKTSTSTHAI